MHLGRQPYSICVYGFILCSEDLWLCKTLSTPEASDTPSLGTVSVLTTGGQGLNDRPRVSLRFPELMHGKPLVGGGSGLALWFIVGPGFASLLPPTGRAGTVTRLCSRRRCRKRGLENDGVDVRKTLFGIGLTI